MEAEEAIYIEQYRSLSLHHKCKDYVIRGQH